MHALKSLVAAVVALSWLVACTTTGTTMPFAFPHEFRVPEPGPPERKARILPLAGPLLQPDAEISGMAWYGDILVLLPQYPHQWGHSLFGLHRVDLARAIAGESDLTLEPFPIPLHGSPAMRRLAGFEGLEAIAFVDDRVYLLAEATLPNHMQGYLLTGTVLSKLSALAMDMTQVAVLSPQTEFRNQSYEALIRAPDGIASIYEANGAGINRDPHAWVNSPDLAPRPVVAMPHVEYRLTDATAVNAAGEFWMVNFHWPGSPHLMPKLDPIAARWGEGPSQAQSDIVERILKFRLTRAGVELIDEPPLELQLRNATVARNWEGIALWEDEGFLLVTDRFPTTMLAYIVR